MEHHMQHNSDRKDAKRREQQLRPVEGRGAPHRPIGAGAAGKNRVQHGEHPALNEEQHRQHDVEPEIDQRQVPAPERTPRRRQHVACRCLAIHRHLSGPDITLRPNTRRHE
jgi:hypothetical protein